MSLKSLLICAFTLLQLCSAANHYSPTDTHRRAIGTYLNKQPYVSPNKIFVPRQKLSRKGAVVLLTFVVLSLWIDTAESPVFSQELCASDGPCTVKMTRLQQYVCPPPTLPCRKLACEIGLLSQKVIAPHEQHFSSPEIIKTRKTKKQFRIKDPISKDEYFSTLAWIERDLLPLDLISLDPHDLCSHVRQTSWLLNSQTSRCVIKKSTSSIVPEFSDMTNMTRYLQLQDMKAIPYYKELTKTILLNNAKTTDPLAWQAIIKDVLHRKIDPYYDFVKRYYDYNVLFRKPTAILLETFEIIKLLFKSSPITCAALIHQKISHIHTQTPNPFADTNGQTARIWMNLLLKKAGYPGIAIHDEETYRKATQDAFNQNRIDIFEDYIKKKMCNVAKASRS